MAIHFHPKQGTVLWCNFEGNKWPEIVKIRPVIIFTPKVAQRDDVVTVVPLSTTAPPRIRDFHCLLEQNPIPRDAAKGIKSWAKCDLVQTVTFTRLDGHWEKIVDGKRDYMKLRISDADMLKIRKAILCGLGFNALTTHLG